MTAFTFSLEQVRSAPLEVRRWMAGEVARALGAVGGVAPEAVHRPPLPPEPATLAACTVPEAARVFELIAKDPVAIRLFFELAREPALDTNIAGVRALRIADLLHHAAIATPDSLVDRLVAIDHAFHQAHGEHAKRLFGFDDAGHVFVHEATQASIRRLWQELIETRAVATPEPAAESVPRYEGFGGSQRDPGDEESAPAVRVPVGADLPF